mgnify:CR=1 FL=1
MIRARLDLVRLLVAAWLRRQADRLHPPAPTSPKRTELDLADFELGARALEHVLVAQGLEPLGVARLIATAPALPQVLGEILARDLADALAVTGQIADLRRAADFLAAGGDL